MPTALSFTASSAADLDIILLATALASAPSNPVVPANPPSAAPIRIISRFLPLYFCASSARSSACLELTPTSIRAFFVSSYMVPLTVPAPIIAPAVAATPVTTAVGALAYIAAKVAAITGAAVPSALATASAGATASARSPAFTCS